MQEGAIKENCANGARRRVPAQEPEAERGKSGRGDAGAEGAIKDKIKGPVRWAVFAASVIALSWVFAGIRGVGHNPGLASLAFLFGSVLLTLGLLGLQGYWIYFEEKGKGSLTKRIELFERIHFWLSRRSTSRNRKEVDEDD